MREHPMLYSTPMVQALWDDRKGMTRRIITQRNSSCSMPFHLLDFSRVYQNKPFGIKVHVNDEGEKHTGGETVWRVSPKWDVGDIIWVKETFKIQGWDLEEMVVTGKYLADDKPFEATLTEKEWEKFSLWKNKTSVKSSLFMFKSLSRISLPIEDIKAERLQDISERDVIAEGVGSEVRQMWLFGLNQKDRDLVYSRYFKKLWESINGEESWNSNPWVWAITFKRQ